MGSAFVTVLLDSLLPMYLLITFGFVASATKQVTTNHVIGLERFLFYISMPCFLFRVVALTDIYSLDWQMVGVQLGGVLAIFIILVFLNMRPGKSRDGGRAPIEWGRAGVVALASTYPSSVFYGVPVISQLYGAQYTPYCVIIFVVCGAVLVPFNIFLTELQKSQDQRREQSLQPVTGQDQAAVQSSTPYLLFGANSNSNSNGSNTPLNASHSITEVLDAQFLKQSVAPIFWRTVRSPPTLAFILGVLWALTKVTLPEPISFSLNMVGSSTSGIALFRLGCFMSDRNSFRGCTLQRGILMIIFKVAIVPLVIFGLLTAAGTDPELKKVGVLCHALPAAQIVFLNASVYQQGVAEATVAVLLGTIISFPFTWFFAVLMDIGSSAFQPILYASRENQLLDDLGMIIGSVGLLSSVLTIALNFTLKPFRKFPRRIVMYVAAAQFFCTLSFMISRFDTNLLTNSDMCTFQAVLIQFFGTGSYVWCSLLAFNLFYTMRFADPTSGQSSARFEKWYIFIGFAWPTLMTLGAGLTGTFGLPLNGRWCWVVDPTFQFALFYAPLLFINIICIGLLISIGRSLRSLTSLTSSKKESTGFRIRLFTIGFLLFWFMGFLNRLQQSFSRRPVLILDFLHTVFSLGQGTLTLIVFASQKRFLDAVRDKIGRTINKWLGKPVADHNPSGNQAGSDPQTPSTSGYELRNFNANNSSFGNGSLDSSRSSSSGMSSMLSVRFFNGGSANNKK